MPPSEYRARLAPASLKNTSMFFFVSVFFLISCHPSVRPFVVAAQVTTDTSDLKLAGQQKHSPADRQSATAVASQHRTSGPPQGT